MPDAYETGVMFSPSMPSWQRTFYDALLLETLRMKSIMVPFCTVKEDFRARDTGQIVFTEVYDTDPVYNPLTEDTIWLKGSHLDSRTKTIDLSIYGDMLKFSDYSEIVQYVNSGNLKGLVQDKIGRNQVDFLDILARNAFLDHPNKVFGGGLRANREAILATDLFDPDFAELARTHLEEAEVPGVVATEDSDIQTIVCVTTPRVIHDIRVAAGSNWLETQQYAGSTRKFTGESGTWGGVRFVRTNRLVLRNHGVVTHQTTLNGATVAGQGSAATVDKVYSPGQSTSTRYITVDDVTGFAVGKSITIHSKDAGEGAGKPPVETDGTQETRRIVAIDAGNKRLSFEKPLLKPHADGDFLTLGVTIHTSIFMGGPAVVYGVAERPTPVFPPKIDDLQMVNRYGWRGFLKFQMFRPEFIEVVETSGTDN
jgi:N4-gp56 family major capsid protein